MAQQRYHVLERIDAGGMAEVFKANSTSLQGFEKLVAIKRILPKLASNERFVRMFLDEAKLSLHLNHTNCVQVFDLGLAGGTYFIVMEFVDGVNLKHVIEETRQRKVPLPVEQVTYVCLEICKGLSHAHEKKDQDGKHLAIVHRDISPPNILISREGEVKITDFGLAKAKDQVEQTDPGVVKGKFGYLSPEAAHGESIDARTDIFAVGILLWEMLTGTRLFLGDTDLDTLHQVRANQIPSLSKYRSDVPHSLEQIIRRALATDPRQRYSSTKELGQDLARFMYSFGRPVTAFDISEWVRAIVENRPSPVHSSRDKAVDHEIQEAINEIVSLEEIDDLDQFLHETYDSLPDQGADLDMETGIVEDPRDWGDFGFGDADFSMREQGDDNEWEQKGLTELMRRRATNPGGHVAPQLKPSKDSEAVNYDRTVEMNDFEGLREDAMRRAMEMNLEAHVDSFRQDSDDEFMQARVPGQNQALGRQSIQPVSDSVSQAMAHVQQQAQQPHTAEVPPQQGAQQGAKGGSKSGGATALLAVGAVVLLAVLALVVFLVMGQ